MFRTSRQQQRKLRQIKYLLRQLQPQKQQLFTAPEKLNLRQRFKRLYAQRNRLPLSYKVKQAAFTLALSLGVHQVQAQVAFAPAVLNPYNLTGVGINVYSGDFVDIDNDGDLDFMYGSYGPIGGYNYGSVLNFQLNTGTATVPNFAAPITNPFGIVPNSGGNTPAPQFADMDGDGDPDMMVTYYNYYGTVNGIEYFQNTGTALVPSFAAPVLNPFGIVNPGYEFANVGLHDLDSDGDVDVLTGEMYDYITPSSIKYQSNTGTATAPSFGPLQNNAFLPATPFPSGSTQAYFDVADLDRDGDLDVFVNYYAYDTLSGYGQFELGYFENVGTATTPSFAPLAASIYNITPGTGAQSEFVDLIFGDLDNDGDEDLLALSRFGGSVYYENISPTGPTPILNFDSTSITLNEAAGNISVGVNITNTSTVAVTVELVIAASSTVDNGLDVVLAPNTTLTFPANSSSSQTILIPLTDDAIVEPTEQLVLALTNPTNFATLGAMDTLVISIIDNDFGVPTISFDTAAYTISEGDGTLSIPITITNPSPNATSVDVSIRGGSTADNNDVTFVSPATLTFGGNTSLPLTLSIPITDDVVFEGTERLILGLSNVSNGGTVGTTDTTTVQILDNEVMPSVSFQQDSTMVNEGVGSIDVPLVLSGALQDTASVEIFVTTLSTATNGVDYLITLPKRMVFAPNTTLQQLNIPITDDVLIEGRETIELALGIQTANLTLGRANARVVIIDNDSAIGTNQLSNAKTIQVYPNPFGKQLILEVEQPAGKAVHLINAVGQVVLKQSLQASSVVIGTEHLPAGLYWIQVYDLKTGVAIWQEQVLHK